MNEIIERFKVTDRSGMIGPKGKKWDIAALYIPGMGNWYLIEETGMIFRNALVQVISKENETLDPDSDEYKMVLAKIVALRLEQ